MMVRAEFTIYPFLEGESPPAYVQAAIERLRGSGIDVEVGLLGQSVSGDIDRVLEALGMALPAAFEAGASRVAINVEAADDGAG